MYERCDCVRALFDDLPTLTVFYGMRRGVGAPRTCVKTEQNVSFIDGDAAGECQHAEFSGQEVEVVSWGQQSISP